jgi:hypothetical protein
MKSVRHVAQVYKNRENAGVDMLNQTLMTNFDGELDEIENLDMNENTQKDMVKMFWTYMREDTDTHNLEKKSGKTKANYGKLEYKLQKVNIVCLKILDVFLSKNLKFIN